MDNNFLQEELQKRRILETNGLSSSEDRSAGMQFVNNKVSCSLDFYNLLKKLFLKAVDIEIVPREKINEFFNKDKQLDKPYVGYKVRRRIPTKNRSKKPTALYSTDNSITYNTSYEYLIQFDIFANDFETAENILNTVEETIESYQSILIQEGVEKCLFERQEEDESLDRFRDDASIRSILYMVQLQKSSVQMISNIEDINQENGIK